MSLLIAILLIHGLDLSPAWYVVATLLWCVGTAARITTLFIKD